MARLLIPVLVVAALTAASPGAAHPPGKSEWSWTPALCKSYLKQYGVRIDDGRSFRATSVFCGGMPECVYDRSDGKFYYDHFLVAMLDGNLVYRTMTLHVTKEDNFRVDKLRVYGRATTTAEVRKFEREAGALVRSVSKKTQASCRIEA